MVENQHGDLYRRVLNPAQVSELFVEARTGRARFQPGHKHRARGPYRSAEGRSGARRAQRLNCLLVPSRNKLMDMSSVRGRIRVAAYGAEHKETFLSGTNTPCKFRHDSSPLPNHRSDRSPLMFASTLSLSTTTPT